MNKIKFDARSLDLYSQDFEYLQNSLENEVIKIFKQIVTNPNDAAIIKGFTLEVSLTDPTKLAITHSGGYGSVIAKSGVIVESVSDIDNIILSDYTNGTYNSAYVKVESIDGSYNRATEVFLPNEKKAIDLSNYHYEYDRTEDSFEIVVYDPVEITALTQTELDKLVYLGRVQAKGAGNPLTDPVDTSGVVRSRTYIQDGSIISSMISPTGFMLPQHQVAQSTIINDDYTGTPSTTQDDLNKLRTNVKGIKGTENWDDPSPTTLFDFDRSINAVHENGVFPNKGNELEVQTDGTTLKIRVRDGLAHVNGSISRVLDTSTGTILTLATPTSTLVGDRVAYNGQRRQFTPYPPSGYSFYIFNSDVIPTSTGIYLGQGDPRFIKSASVLITNSINGPLNPGSVGFILNTDYTINYDTGLVTLISSRMIDCWNRLMPPSGFSETDDGIFECYYEWSTARWDAVTMGSDNALTVFTGAQSSDPQVPVTSSGVVDLAYVFVRPFDASIGSQYIKDSRFYINKVREIIDIPVDSISTTDRAVERINYYTSTGEPDLYVTSTGPVCWELFTTSTGDTAVKTSTNGSYLETVVYAKVNAELWLITDKTPWVNSLKIEYSDPNSETLSHSVNVDLFFNTLLYKYPVFIVDSIQEGYIKIRITVEDTNKEFTLFNVLVGKLDLYYNKHSLSDIDYIVPQKITNYRGPYAPIYRDNDDVRKGRLVLNSLKTLCGTVGSQLEYYDIEQVYPVSRIGNYICPSGGISDASILSGLGETTNDIKTIFTINPDIIGGENHQRVAIKIKTKGDGYTDLRVLIHDNSHTLHGSIATKLFADVTADDWNYFEIPVTLDSSISYHYHLYYTGSATLTPDVYCLSPGSNDKEVLYLQFYTPTEGLYKSTDVINIVDRTGTSIIAERTNGENSANGRHDLNRLDLMAVDLSNNTTWDNWEYDWAQYSSDPTSTGRYIGIDVVTGRIKFPSGYDAADYFVEFNTKELGTKTDAKSQLRHGTTQSIDDSFETIRQGCNLHLNGIVNGNFDIWQRVRKGSTDWVFDDVLDGEYSADMMRTYRGASNTATVNISRQTGTGTSTYCLRAARSAGTDSWGFSQRMLSVDSLKYRGEKVTASIELRKGSALTSAITIEAFKSTVTDNFGSLTSMGSITIDNDNLSTTSFRRFYLTVDLSSHSDMTNIEIRVTAGSMAGAANVYFEAQKFMLNLGENAYHFQPKSFIRELEDCLAFYEKTYDYATVPGATVTAGAAQYQTRTAINATTAGTLYVPFSNFANRKNGTVAVTLYNPSSGTASSIRNVTASTDRNGSTVTSATQRGFTTIAVDNTSANAIALDAVISFHYVAKLEL